MPVSTIKKTYPLTGIQKLPIDLILFNGKIITLDENSSITEALAIGHGRILDTGKNPKIKALAGKKTEMIDLEGHTVIPGLIDSHVHIDAMVSLLSSGLPIDHVKEIDATVHPVKRENL